ncbi:MAG: ABC transporter ATP-binding protein, partial [Deltaproteobacteria bacterium]
ILLQSPDLLLLDEPTNHLDLQSLVWLEAFLVNYPGAILLVSHDRAFLNHLVDRIGEIDGQKINLYHGDYDHYLAEKEARRRILEATHTTQQKKIEQTERFIERFRYKNTKARQVQSRIRMLEKLERVELPEEAKEVRFHFPVPKRSGQKVIEVKQLHKRYGDLKVYEGIDLALFRGEKVALVGPNGAGKSTLLKILAGVLDFEKGEVELGKDVTRSYFAQYQLDLLHPEHTVFEEILEVATDEAQTQLRNLLGAFLFRGEEIEKKVSILSGGEKSRLLLAQMLLKPPNFLLLDEPTSHLDIPSRNVLETALKQFQGTICFITHDRHLINRIANKVIEIDQGKANLFLGNYDDYLYMKQQFERMERQGEERLFRAEALPQPMKKSPYQLKEERKREAYQMDQYRRKLQAIERKLQEVEKLLDESTGELDQLNQRLSEPSLYLNPKETYETIQTHRRTQQRVKELSERWESIALELEAMKETA